VVSQHSLHSRMDSYRYRSDLSSRSLTARAASFTCNLPFRLSTDSLHASQARFKTSTPWGEELTAQRQRASVTAQRATMQVMFAPDPCRV